MTCNHCHPLCQCGAEAEAGRRLLADVVFPEQRKMTRDEADAYYAAVDRMFEPVEPTPRFPELEATEAALANYAEAK